MAHTLSLIYGSTTVALTAGDYNLDGYAPQAGNGYSVTEKFDVVIRSSSEANLQTAIEGIEKAFRAAHSRYDTGIGDKVYLKFQPDGLGTLYRSEIIRPKPGTDAGRVKLPVWLLGPIWNAHHTRATIFLTRRDYWEDNAETELSLANGGGSGAGGQDIYNPHTAAIFADTTVSFATANYRITDSGSGFNMFAVGDTISVRGSGSNDGIYTVEEIDAGDGYIDTNEPITTETADVITNGVFAADTDWDKGVGWTIAAGVANCDGTQVAVTDLDQNSVLVVGVAYSVSFDILNYNAGNVTPYAGSTGAGTARSANGTHVETITCAGSTDFILQGDAAFDADVDNVIVLSTITIYDVQNYVHIAAAAIGGVLPTPIKLQLTNSDAGADLETVWVGSNRQSTPAAFAHLLEAEDSATGADVFNAAASSGRYRQYSVTTAAAVMTSWTLPSELLTSAASAYFRVVARFFDGTDITLCKYKLQITYGGQTLYDGGYFEFDDTYAGISRLYREFDTVQLPPYKLEGGTPTDLTLKLWAQSTSGSTETPRLDFLQLTPLDSWRKLTSGDGLAQNSILVDDGIDSVYYQEVSSEQVRDITAEGSPIYLTPAEDHRIYFLLHSETADTADRDRVASAKIYYRPRLRTF